MIILYPIMFRVGLLYGIWQTRLLTYSISVHTCVVGTESIARVIVYMLSYVHTPQARQTTLLPKNDKLIHYFRLVAKSDFIFFFLHS